jgi:DivIVA domain-containing protein
VDDLVDRVLAGLDGSGQFLTVEEVRRAPFRPRRGGYREEAVDDALDRVVEHLLLVQRAAPPQQQFPMRSAD